MIILGSAQRNCYKGYVNNGISSCLTSAMGMGGGQIPMLIEIYEDYNTTMR